MFFSCFLRNYELSFNKQNDLVIIFLKINEIYKKRPHLSHFLSGYFYFSPECHFI